MTERPTYEELVQKVKELEKKGIKQKKTDDELRDRIKKLSSLNSLNIKISNSLLLDQVVKAALEEIVDTINPDIAMLYIWQNDKLIQLGSHAGNPKFNDIKREFLSFGQCLCGLAGEGEPVYSLNIHDDNRCRLEECKRIGIHSFAALPLGKENKILGVLGLASVTEKDFGKISPFLETLANQVSIGFNNALLYEQVNKYAGNLEHQVAKRKKAKKELLKKTHELGERIKELNCLYNVASIFTQPGKTADEILRQIIEIIPPAWQYPDITCAHIIFEGKEFKTANFKVTDWKQSADIFVSDRKSGILEVYYLKDMPELAEQPFLKEEKILIDGLAGLIGERLQCKKSEDILRRVNRSLLILSKSNHYIIHATNEINLLNDICRIIIDNGYRLAWVGYAEMDAEKKVSPVAQAGFEQGYLEKVNITWSNTDRGRGPTGTAIRSGKPSVARYITSDKRFAPWRNEALKRGYESSLALPLITSDQQAIGALNIYSEEPDSFNVDETQLLMDLANNLVYGIVSLRTQEDHKRAVKELRKSEMLFRTYFQLGAIGMAVTSVDKKWLYVNNYLCKMLGYSEKELRQKTWLELTYSEDIEKDVNQFDRLIAGEIDTYTMDKRFIRKDGEIVDTSLSVACARNDDNSIEYFISHLQDISERKKAEEELRQAQKMEAIGTLSGGIAHDFNNILSVIIGYAELSLINLPQSNNIYKNLKAIDKAGKMAADLVSQILTFSRSAEQQKQTLYMHTVVKESLKLLRSTLPTTIDIRQNIDTKCRPILADITQIRQVIMNLGTNAYHAMRESGGVLEVKLKERGEYISLTVSDTGYGMEKKILSRIFEPYFTTKKQNEGTGLGLAIVHGIVKDHGGEIIVKSEVGKGTTFEVLFPAIDQILNISKDDEFDSPLPQFIGRVLFVDDERAIIDFGEQILRQLGCDVVSANSSMKALEIFSADPEGFDLVITDQTMPSLTGAELAKKILEVRADIPIALTTGFSEIINEEEAKAIGIREFIFKPLSIDNIIKITSKILEQKN